MRGFVRGVIWLAVILGAVGVLLWLFVVDSWRVPAGVDQFPASIQPTLAVDDLILVRRSGTPGYGELARCVSPRDGSLVVGRVFGVPGDHVEVTDDIVTTNGRPFSARHGCPAVTIPHPVTQSLVKMNCAVGETGAWSFEYLTSSEHFSSGRSAADVAPGKLYLLSDNRLMHQDSRDFGQVDQDSCQHIVYRLWGEKYTDDSRRFTLLW